MLRLKKIKHSQELLENLPSDQAVFNVVNEIEKTFDLRKLKAGIKIYFYQDHIKKKLAKIIIPIKNDINLDVLIAEEIIVKKRHLKINPESLALGSPYNFIKYCNKKKKNYPPIIELLPSLIF